MITILSVSRRSVLASLASGAMLMAACGSSETTSAGSSEGAGSLDRPTIVVSTNIMGDVVENLVGEAATVVTIMPVGADPHDFQPSAQQIAQLNDADAVIINGAGFEEGLIDIVEAAEADGVLVFEAISVVETLEFDSHDEDHDEEGHDEEGHDDEDHDDHEHSGGDPHFFTDPARMALSAEAVASFLIAEVEGIDAEAVRASSDAYIAELESLDSDVAEILSAVSEEDRVMVTNHEVFGYFADRYDFEVIGSVIPGGTTVDSADAESLAELAEIIEAEGIPAVFSDTSSSDELAQTLALEAGAVEMVELFSESLGDADSDGSTYLDMVRANAERIADALTR